MAHILPSSIPHLYIFYPKYKMPLGYISNATLSLSCQKAMFQIQWVKEAICDEMFNGKYPKGQANSHSFCMFLF